LLLLFLSLAFGQAPIEWPVVRPVLIASGLTNPVAIVHAGDRAVASKAQHVIEVPACADLLAPLITVIPLQLLAYHIAVRLGCDVDQPRNLAKSVTVE